MSDRKRLSTEEKGEIARLASILSGIGRSSQTRPGITNDDLWRVAQFLNDYLKASK